MFGTLLTALADLVFPLTCAGCDAAGTALCRRCAETFSRPARPALPTPRPAGLPPCWTAGEYDGPVRAALLAYKEEGRRALVPVLAGALAAAVRGALAEAVVSGRAVSGRAGPAVVVPGLAGPVGMVPGGPGPAGVMVPGGAGPAGVVVPDGAGPAGAVSAGVGPVWLLPIPSRAAAVRARGGDHVDRLARAAATELRRCGRSVEVVPLLVSAGHRRDSAGLDAGQRRANLAGAFRLRPGAARAASGSAPGSASGSAPGSASRSAPGSASRSAPGSAPGVLRRLAPTVVLVDDLVTTGATLAEAAGVLRTFGVAPVYAAVVAATVRRIPITACRDTRHALDETGGDGTPPSG